MDEIVYGLMTNLKDHLQNKLVTNVPSAFSTYLEYEDQDGDTRVFKPPRVQVGRLQADPTVLSNDIDEPSVYVAISPNDPTDTSRGWQHGVVSDQERAGSNLGLRLGYPYELGGSKLWWRRFHLRSVAFFIYSNQTKAESARLANLLRALLELYCESYRAENLHGWQCGGLTDGFGETALASHVARTWTYERGGPDDDYIWDIELWLQVLTERS